ncbi:MAG: hypothetical protein KBG15_11740, partial [Kofleriaceae bacterium]|nr:hypothetical protein [Kofleriaceae bacterium]
MNVMRVSLAAVIVTGAIQSAGCHHQASPPPTPVDIGPVTPMVRAPADTTAVVPAVGFSTIVVAGANGVAELRFDGTLVKQWSHTAAKQPRFDREHRRLMFLSANNRDVRELHFGDGKERVLATLPPTFELCAAAPDYPKGEIFSLDRLDVQADEDFVIAGNDNAACLSLKDRNVNMLNVDVNVHIDFTTGRVHTAMVMPPCQGKLVATCPRVPPRPAPPAPNSAARWPYDVENGNIVKRTGTNTVVTQRLGVDNFSIDLAGASASARWLPIRGNVTQGDYIHASLLLVDRSNGSIWPIKVGPTSPLSSQEIRAIESVATVDVVGESSIRWITSPALPAINSSAGTDQSA